MSYKCFILITNLLLIFFLSGCNDQGQDDFLAKKWYYPNGNIRKVQEYKLSITNDTIITGIYLYYNENEVLIDSAKIVNNKFHGNRYIYGDDGSLNKITTYKNDVYRKSISFDSAGNMEYYRAYNYGKDLMFLIKFDSFGRIQDYQGDPIYSWVLEQSYKVGDTISIELLVPRIPEYETEVTVIDSKSGVEETYTPDEFNRVVYYKPHTDATTLNIHHYAAIKDREGKVIITDTLVFYLSSKGEMTYEH